MTMKAFIIVITITVFYVIYSVWNAFIAKRKTKLTALDIAYVIVLMLFTGLISELKIVLLIGVFLIVWLAIILRAGYKNAQEKE